MAARAVFYSAISNCAVADGAARDAARAAWGARLNRHHLFDAIEDAVRFGDEADRRVPEHAPFHVLHVYVQQPGWVKVGVLTLTPDGAALRTEVRDVAGKVVPTENAPATKEGAIKPWIVASTCKLGGTFAYVDEKAVKATDNVRTFELHRPAKDDEAGDLAALCTKPSMERAASGLDPSQDLRIAAAHYDETLTSRRWRTWLMTMTRDVAQTDDTRPYAERRKAMGDELAKGAAAAGKPSCWFANALLGP